MNILMVTSETVPFSKSGGLADVVGALSTELRQMGHDVRVFMPCYGSIDTSEFEDLHTDFMIPMPGGLQKVSLIEKDVSGVPYYALCHPMFTKRKGIYGDTSFSPYPDNLRRYSLFSKAVFPAMLALDFNADIIHCHDWTTGFVPYLLKTEKHPAFENTKSVFTIHNLAYQGTFSRLELLESGIEPDKELFDSCSVDKRVNMLRAGLVYSDAITTVSPTYAKEIQSEEYGCGLNKLLVSRNDVLSGIINGIDYAEWNSETDNFFTEHFNSDNLDNKYKLKEKVQKEFGLKPDRNVPLVAMISRMAIQKGFEELLSGEECVLEKIIRENDVQFLIIGTGDSRYEDRIVELGEKYENLSANIIFSTGASHRVEAAADFFLMPSRYEPCGLNQLYSLRYGTLPIARRTGGLADTIADENESREGTGFLFDEMTPEAIEKAVLRALNLYTEDRGEIEAMRKRSIESDFSWRKSANTYLEVYQGVKK